MKMTSMGGWLFSLHEQSLKAFERHMAIGIAAQLALQLVEYL